jgi:hypothetical protein
MDYSSSLHDDNPAGVSPWGASPVASPQHPRTSPYPPSGDAPSSPTPYSTQSSSASYANEDTMGAEGQNEPQGTAASSYLSEGGSHRPATAESGHSQPDSQQQFGGLLPPQQKGPEPLRSQPQGRQAQETQGPQYKLQAKITGLERTGRKDPILRFDVHVRTLLHIP